MAATGLQTSDLTSYEVVIRSNQLKLRMKLGRVLGPATPPVAGKARRSAHYYPQCEMHNILTPRGMTVSLLVPFAPVSALPAFAFAHHDQANFTFKTLHIHHSPRFHYIELRPAFGQRVYS